MNFVVVIFLGFSATGFLITLRLLFSQSGDRKANRLLAAIAFLFSLELLSNCLRWTGWIEHRWLGHFYLIHFPFWLVYGPLVYCYVRRVITHRWLRSTDLLFTVPPLVIIVLLWDFYTLTGIRKTEVMAQGLVGDYILFPSFGIWIVIPLMFFYALLTYVRFGPARNPVWRQNRWIRWFVGSYLGFVVAFSSYIVLIRNGWMDPSMDYLVDLGLVLCIGSLVYFGVRHPKYFKGTIRLRPDYIKYKNTGLGPALSRDMALKLTRVMEQDRPFLNPDLRLDDLAGMLGLSRNQTSQLINEKFDRAFFDFINEYRIEEAKELLEREGPGTITVTEVAYQVGFNTRASFYKAFRKFSNRTPGSYLSNEAAKAS